MTTQKPNGCLRTLLPGILLCMSLALLGCRQANHASEAPTVVTNPSDISTGDLKTAGLNPEMINALADSLRTGFYPNRHALLVYKDSALILEEYFAGTDEEWGEDLGLVHFSDTVLHDLRSVSKSVVSACIGIAIAQGKIESVNQPVFDFFPDYAKYANAGREHLTLRHLLTMTSGLKWNEEVPYDNPENSEIQMINSGDGLGYVLSRELVHPPGEQWQYNGGTTEVLAAIVERVSGMDIHAFAREHLFAPMGITRSFWTISPSMNAPAAASGLRLTPRDMLKFGMLYLQHGKWGEQQILPREWVQASLASQTQRPGGGGYGYQFWVFPIPIGDEIRELPAAVGNGDQLIVIDQNQELLVVTTAGNYNRWDIANNSRVLVQNIYAALE